MEAKLRNSLYKIELHWIKIIPMVLCALSFTDTILSYFEVDGNIISYLNALLVWLFLYLSSFVFQFCRWHRMFLYYLLVEGCINCYDYEIGIPLGLKDMIDWLYFHILYYLLAASTICSHIKTVVL